MQALAHLASIWPRLALRFTWPLRTLGGRSANAGHTQPDPPAISERASASRNIADEELRQRRETLAHEQDLGQLLAALEVGGRLAGEAGARMMQTLGWINVQAQAVRELLKAAEEGRAERALNALITAVELSCAENQEVGAGLSLAGPGDDRPLTDLVAACVDHFHRQTSATVALTVGGARLGDGETYVSNSPAAVTCHSRGPSQ